MCNSRAKGQMADSAKTLGEEEGKVSYANLAIYIFVSIIIFATCCIAAFFSCRVLYKRRCTQPESRNEPSVEMTLMDNKHHNGHMKFSDQTLNRTRTSRNRGRNGDMPDVIAKETTGSELNIPFDRNRVTGASSCNSVLFSQNIPNPPPSPQTMASVSNASMYYHPEYINRPPSSHASTLQSYHRKQRERMRGFAPPPTPCSTDLNEDSDFSSDVVPPLRPIYNTLPRRQFRSGKMYRTVPSDENCCGTDSDLDLDLHKVHNPPPSPIN